MATYLCRKQNGEMVHIERPDWLENAPQTPLSKSLGHRHEYRHDIVCNGDRRFPIGTPGKCCSCLGRAAVWSKTEKRFVRMDEKL